MTTSILLTGGTGTLGRQVMPLLVDAGFEVRVLSRQARENTGGVQYVTGDLLKDEGVEAAVDGAQTVLHLAGGPKGDEEATRNLARAASAAGVGHLVLISVIAADKVPVGYYRAKLGAERVVAECGVPWTTLRAAQFHDLLLTVVRTLAKSPVLPVPGGVRCQPVDARDVAKRLVELAGGGDTSQAKLRGPAGLVRDLAGPQVIELGDAARDYLKATGKRRPSLTVWVPGKAGRVLRAGENLNLDADKGERTWADFLAGRPA